MSLQHRADSHSDVLRVMAGNTHGNPHLMTLGRKAGAHILAPTEATRFLERYTNFRGYRSFYGQGAADHRRGPNDNPIFVSKSITMMGDLAIHASDPSTPIRLAPERWINTVMFMFNNHKVALVNIHPNAAVGNKSANVDRVQEYDKSMQVLDDVLTFLLAGGYRRIVHGDLNFRESDSSVLWMDPYELFRHHGMKYGSVAIDGYAYDRNIIVDSNHLLSRKQIKSDHPGFLMEYAIV